MEKVITIPKEIIKKGDLVLIPRKEYEEFLRLRKQREWEEKDTEKAIKIFQREKRQKKLMKIKSLADLDQGTLFKKAYQKLPKQIKVKAKEKEKIFREDSFNPILETHRLHGKYRNYWAFSIDKSYRIMFQFLNTTKEKVVFINVGTHDIYK